MSQKIICPNCNMEFDLDKAQEEEFSKILKEKEQDFEKKMEQEKTEMREKAKKFAEERVEEERKKQELEMKDMQDRLKKSEQDREEAKKRELEFLKKQRELEDKEKNFELEMEKKVYNETKKRTEDLEKRMKELGEKELEEKMKGIQEDFRKKELEYQKQNEQMKKSLDEAQRKANQGSQQIQGDISENDLKQALIQAFPIDIIEDVATGIKGADIIQKVRNNLGQEAGTIIWESKNTKTWQDSWIMKLKEDKLKVGGNIAILVSNVIPNNLKNFGVIDEVIIVVPEYAVQIVELLRDKLLSISRVEKSMEGKDLKMELLYKYLASEEFSGKINMMIDVFKNLKEGIEMERRAMERNWKRREKDIERASIAVSGMFGELESLMGKSLSSGTRLELYSGEMEDNDYEEEDTSD